MHLVIPLVDLYKNTRRDRRNLYSSFRIPAEYSIQAAYAMTRISVQMRSQRIIPLLLGHKAAIRCQGLAVRIFRNMMAQKVHMPLLFSRASWTSKTVTTIHRT